MAPRRPRSAGLLLFRGGAAHLEVLLGHPGGPFWQNKDDGAWSIPKGLIGAGEAPLSAARREFAEETGYHPDGDFLPLGEARQPGGKVVRAWAIAGDWDPALIQPPSSAGPPVGSRRARRSGAQGSGGRSISRSAGRQDGRFRGRAGTARRTQEARRRGRYRNDRRPGRARPGRGPLGDRSDLSRTRCGHGLDYGHLTAAKAAELAATAGVKRLVLTYISGRYPDEEILAEAVKIFSNSRVAADLDRLAV